jgi:glucosamine--fructose-6-phosphate aminotransferase (isomerizing)
MTDDTRTHHPFHMYDAVLGQPDAFVEVIRRHDAALARLAGGIASCDRVFIVGIGTSGHAAQVGEHLLRAYGGRASVRAFPSFDFALYGPSLTAKDCVIGISHRGNKNYTVEALARARKAGCRTALVTGEGGPEGKAEADEVFETVPQERSSTHTISYMTAIAMLSALAGHLGHRRTGTRLLPERVLLEEIPAALAGALAHESEMASWARAHLGRRRIWLTGGGPSAVTAAEVALKIKEAAYLQAEGQPIETFLHGPFQCAEPEDVFILIAPAGAAQSRVRELAGMIPEIGAASLIVTDAAGDSWPGELRKGAAGWCAVPAVPEPFSTLTCLVPLQLFSYHLALARGTNPDVFRLDDPRFARARARVTL